MPATTADPTLEALHRRIQQVAEKFSQSEIARKTGTSRNNVSRYVRGAKMPLEFGAALATELGVNPAWLLTGEGSQWLSDTTEGTAKMAGDILELVEAMNAVARMRLGSLTGKHHLRVLRELNDALVRYEKLRDELNVRTSPIFKELLEQYRGVLNSGDLDRADDLRRALTQLARLNDDTGLQAEFDTHRAHHEYWLGNVEKTIEIQRDVLFHNLTRGGITEQGCSEAHNLAMAMHRLFRLKEARRIAEATLVLAGEQVDAWKEGRLLDALVGVMMVDMGEVAEGMARLQRHVAHRTDIFHGISSGLLIRAQLLAGVISLETAYHIGEPIHSRASRILQFATWHEDPDQLQRACDECIGPGLERVAPDFASARYAKTMLALLKGEDGGEGLKFIDDLIGSVKGRPRSEWILPNILAGACRLYRLAGQRRPALKLAKEAGESLKLVPEEITLDVLTYATHHRNVLELVPADTRSKELGEMRQAALAFFRQQVDRGFGLFLEYLQRHNAD